MNKRQQHLEKIKDTISNSHILNEDEKTSSVRIVEEWYREDLAKDVLKDKLVEVSEKFEEILADLGIL